MPCLRSLLVAAALVLVPATASAQGRPCSDPDYRAFDFWVGDWIAYDKETNRELGRDIVDRFLDGCVILENWIGSSGFNGTSLNMYVMDDGKWRQTWTDNQGAMTLLEGGIRDGKMVMEGTVPTPDAVNERGRIRITWAPMPQGGGVREIGELSLDGGTTWQPDFDILYVPNKLAPVTDAPATQEPASDPPAP